MSIDKSMIKRLVAQTFPNGVDKYFDYEEEFDALCRAIEAAVLEELAKQEPVAWVYYPKGVGEKYVSYTDPASLDLGKQADQIAFIQPLYAAPVVQPDTVMVPRNRETMR